MQYCEFRLRDLGEVTCSTWASVSPFAKGGNYKIGLLVSVPSGFFLLDFCLLSRPLHPPSPPLLLCLSVSVSLSLWLSASPSQPVYFSPSPWSPYLIPYPNFHDPIGITIWSRKVIGVLFVRDPVLGFGSSRGQGDSQTAVTFLATSSVPGVRFQRKGGGGIRAPYG